MVQWLLVVIILIATLEFVFTVTVLKKWEKRARHDHINIIISKQQLAETPHIVRQRRKGTD